MKTKLNPWPIAIFAYFVVFISGVIAWVSFAMRHEDQLVRKDYYEQEIQFQNQIESVARTAPIKSLVQVRYAQSEQMVQISIPVSFAKAAKGELRFYRPSDSKLDESFPLALNENGAQSISVAKLPGGLWKLRMSWRVDGADYYMEQPLMLCSNCQ
jgi:hypothetical protein